MFAIIATQSVCDDDPSIAAHREAWLDERLGASQSIPMRVGVLGIRHHSRTPRLVPCLMQNAPERNQLLDELRRMMSQRFRRSMRQAVEEALRAADDVLFDWAYKQTASKKDAEHCLDLMRMLRQRREAFVEEFIAQFDRTDTSRPVRRAASARDDAELTLISDDELDLDCAVTNFVSAVSSECSLVRSDIRHRIQAISPEAADNDSDPIHWAISTEHVAEAFRSAASDLQMDTGMQIVLFKLFERCAAPALARGYSLIAEDLQKAGFEPARPRVVTPGTQAHVEQPSLGRPADPSSSQGAAGVAEPGGPATQGGFSSAGPSAGAGAPHMPYGYGPHATLVQGFVDQLSAAMGGAPTGAASASSHQARQGASSIGGFVNAQVSNAQSLIGRYAQQAPDPGAAGQALGPLTVPIAQLATVQPEILRDPNHPIRLLLEQASVAAGSFDAEDAGIDGGQELIEDLRSAIDEAAKGIDWSKVDRLPSAEESAQADWGLEGVLQSRREDQLARMRERAIAYAKAHVNDLVRRTQLVAGGETWLGVVMTPLLRWVWIVRGERSDDMATMMTLMENCAALMDPGVAPAIREEVDPLIDQLRAALERGRAASDAIDEISTKLRQHHANACEAHEDLAEAVSGADLAELNSAEDDAPAPHVLHAGEAPHGSVSEIDEPQGDEDESLVDDFGGAEADPTVENLEPARPREESDAQAQGASPETEEENSTASSISLPRWAQRMRDRQTARRQTEASRQNRDSSEKRRRDEWVRHHILEGDWWRLRRAAGGRANFGRVVRAGGIGEPIVFEAVAGNEEIVLEWTELLSGLDDGAARPLNPTSDFLPHLRELSKAA